MMIFGYLVPMLRLVQIGVTVAALGGFFGWRLVHDQRVRAAAVVADRAKQLQNGEKIVEKAQKARAAVPVVGSAERLRQPATGNCRDC